MAFILKHFDTPLLKFNASADPGGNDAEIVWVNEEKKELLPLDLKLTPEGLDRWIRRRAIPQNRAYVHAFLAKCGLSINRPMNIISVCKGLSLTDCYWVVADGFEGVFAKYNLYDNNLSRILAYVAFTGLGSNIRSSLASSPEFTTNGMLPKCWRRLNGKVLLYKGGTSGASNTGNEPFSEYYAAQVAGAMGVNAIAYNLSKWKGNLCSSCELFTSKDYSFMPVGSIITSGGFTAVENYHKKLGNAYTEALHSMMIFDAIICNTDRHYGNFGFLVDNHTNQIAAPAPLFDHGNALFNLAGGDDWDTADHLEKYIASLMPRVYDDFIGAAKSVMTATNHEQLRHLLKFTFKRHPKYNLPEKRLMMIEQQIQKRARLLLK